MWSKENSGKGFDVSLRHSSSNCRLGISNAVQVELSNHSTIDLLSKGGLRNGCLGPRLSAVNGQPGRLGIRYFVSGRQKGMHPMLPLPVVVASFSSRMFRRVVAQRFIALSLNYARVCQVMQGSRLGRLDTAYWPGRVWVDVMGLFIPRMARGPAIYRRRKGGW